MLAGAVCIVCGEENGRAVIAGDPRGADSACGVWYDEPMLDMAVAKALRSVVGDKYPGGGVVI